jgi:hypothetical protein
MFCVDGTRGARALWRCVAIWSAAVIVRPVDAVRMTASLDEIHGSGSTQSRVLESAKHLSDWPDPGPTVRHHLLSTSEPLLGRRAQAAQASRVDRYVSPRARTAQVGERDGYELEWASLQEAGSPLRAGSTHFGILQDGVGAADQQASDVSITLLGDAANPLLASARVLARHEPEPAAR